jgi:serpin B
MNRAVLAVLAAIAFIGLTACAQPVYGDEIKSSQPRLTPASLPVSDGEAAVSGNTAFALDLYRQFRQQAPGANLIYSPYSLSAALAMAYAGARGNTEKQMAQAVHFTLPQDRLHSAFNALDQDLSKRQGVKGKDEKGFRLNIINATWAQKNYPFLPAFLDTLARNYGAGLRVVDFATAPEPCRVTINDWVARQTEDRIKDLILPGQINTLTRLVLTNAVYFNAAWLTPFDERATMPGSFNLLDCKVVTVPMMRQTASLGYYRTDLYEAVELPYDGRELSMVILLPKAGQYTGFENALNPALLGEAAKGLRTAEVRLTMPKFKIEVRTDPKQALIALGMTDAFDRNLADFAGITGKPELYITDVLHKAFVEVDEAGTEAAAASAIIFAPKMAPVPPQPVTVTIDRPFLYFIRDIKTGTLLFAGCVLNPV